jgi:hypothetical protein
MAGDTRYTRADLVSMFAASIGEGVANDRILHTARNLGLPTDSFTLEEAQRILEDIASEPGLIGITARFAKSRVALRWKK